MPIRKSIAITITAPLTRAVLCRFLEPTPGGAELTVVPIRNAYDPKVISGYDLTARWSE